MGDLLQQGIAALKAGDKATAHRLLDRAVRVNIGWLTYRV
jgi:hypothetical protein